MSENFSETALKPVIMNRSRFFRCRRVCQSLNQTAILFPFALLIFATLGCRMLQSSPHKTDAQLTTEFQQNRQKFDRLVAMVKEDKKFVPDQIVRAGKTEGLSRSRVEEYKKLVEGLNLLSITPNVNEKSAEPVTRIYFKSTAYEKKGEFICKYTEDKGFVWYENGKQPAKREARSLDREYAKGRDVQAESRIDDNWSLFYSYETCVKD